MHNMALPPTISEVTIYFCSSLLPHFMRNTPHFDYLNLYFDFVEPEAKEKIKEVYKKYSIKETKDDYRTFCRMLNRPYSSKAKTITVKDYKEFFELLTRLYQLEIEKYMAHEKASYGMNRMKNFFKDVWLRASNLDFQDINGFLKKQIDMYETDIFPEYEDEYYLGKYNDKRGILLSCHNKISKPWDECPYEMVFGLHPESLLEDWNGYFTRFANYELPKVRYGIYEENGEKICRIGSIQKDIYNETPDDKIAKDAKRMRYRLNNDEGIEPNKMISLFLFINLLKTKGITKIEIPAMYPLDYDYHVMRSKFLAHDLYENWTLFRIECDPAKFEETKNYFLENYKQEYKISKIKTEDLINVGLKTCSYIDTASVLDLDNRILIDVGDFTKENVTNGLLSELSLQVENRTGKNYVKRMSLSDYYKQQDDDFLDRLLSEDN